MKYKKLLQIYVFTLAIALLSSCTEKQGEGSSQSKAAQLAKPVVYVSNYPLQYFVKRIAPWVEVRFPANASGDPASWKPTAKDVSAMQQADLIILNGASYESWLKNVSLPQSKLIITTDAFHDQLIPTSGKTTHSHGLEGEHEHSETAFTTWLDMKLATEQARAIKTALFEHWPDRQTQLQQSFTELEKDLLAFDAQIKNIVQTAPNQLVIFSHPVYQYLQKRYGINGISVHWEPDTMPDEAAWQELTKLNQSTQAKWMIWEGEPMPEVVSRLKSMGTESVVFAPCACTPTDKDFLSVMKANLIGLRIAYGIVDDQTHKI